MDIIGNNPRDLGGFKKKSFTIYYGGGEIWIEHLDGLYNYEELVFEKLEEDTRSFCRPSGSSLICVNLYETVITDKIRLAIIEAFTNTQKRFTKICFVGADRKSVRYFRSKLSERGIDIRFENDFEKAKEWLVLEKFD